MELQNYISENSDYDKTLKERGFIVKNFNKYDLKLIKYPYDKNVDTNTFERYLKGCIVDAKTNKVVMIPMPKVTAKPFTGPDPKKNSIVAAIRVVILASSTVILALL